MAKLKLSRFAAVGGTGERWQGAKNRIDFSSLRSMRSEDACGSVKEMAETLNFSTGLALSFSIVCLLGVTYSPNPHLSHLNSNSLPASPAPSDALSFLALLLLLLLLLLSPSAARFSAPPPPAGLLRLLLLLLGFSSAWQWPHLAQQKSIWSSETPSSAGFRKAAGRPTMEAPPFAGSSSSENEDELLLWPLWWWWW
uniref:Uncharacterized protein n=1 Tax=Anopheles atroparvus TaxID=41427 RepID=A0A182J8Y9_ANOAO